MKDYNLPACLPRLRMYSLTGSCCLFFVLLVLCGNAQPATITFDPDASFNTVSDSVADNGHGLWATDVSGRAEQADIQNNNGTSRVNSPAVGSDSPSRLSFFYVLGTAIIIALLVEILSKKDI
jgi:hypothetical protein